MRIDAQIVDVLLGQGGLDARLSAFCRVQWPAVDAGFEPCLSATVWEQLQVSVHAALTTSRTRQFYFCGPRGSGRRRTGEALAARAGRPLLHVDLAHARRDGEMQEGLRLACREAWLMGAVLFVEEPAARDGDAAQWQHELAQALDAHRGVAIVASATPWVPDPALPLGMTGVRFVLPDAAARCRCWQRELAQRGVSPEPHVLATLGARYRLWPGQVRDAVLGLELPAAEAASAPAQAAHVPPLDRLLAAARAQGGDRLAAYARHIEPVATRDDIVLPADAVAQLEELCARVLQGPRVLHDWGFGAKLSQGKGTSALFAGPSGTGKTMAAEVVANALALDLYKIDLAGVVSKYIGETEKNLDRIFDAAADANAILFFDEADALFGKRSEVRDSHDRYANLEISYLLQRMEQYEGVTILATNLRQNLDEAFVRRLAFCVHFPFPDEADRAHIWRRVWPASLPMADDVDFDRLARQFKLAGGNIRNIVMAAAFLAAGEGTAVAMSHLLHAARREYQKMGKELTAAELSQASVVLLERRA
jgi:AAA+ superfamily predicted ATPase